MKFKVQATPRFEKELKKLAKKYSSLKAEYFNLIQNLSVNPILGTDLGNNTYKIRLAIASKKKGKSGGARVISIVIHSNLEVLLVAIYDKSEKETISDKEIRNISKEYIKSH